MATKEINIQKGDKILAMLSFRGNVIAKISEGNYSSVEELTYALAEIAKSHGGLFQLFIRNFTKGWHIDHPIFLRSQTSKPKRDLPLKQECINNQYIIAFD